MVEDSSNIQCKVDGRIFKFYSSFSHHKKTHHSEEAWACSICENIFSSKRDLTTHITKDKHTDNIYSCEKCDKRFLKKANLTRHVESVHEENVIDVKIVEQSSKERISSKLESTRKSEKNRSKWSRPRKINSGVTEKNWKQNWGQYPVKSFKYKLSLVGSPQNLLVI